MLYLRGNFDNKMLYIINLTQICFQGEVLFI